MKITVALSNRIKELIPQTFGRVKLNQKVEARLNVFNYSSHTFKEEWIGITEVERIKGRTYVSDGFNDFTTTELWEEDAEKILQQLKEA